MYDFTNSYLALHKIAKEHNIDFDVADVTLRYTEKHKKMYGS